MKEADNWDDNEIYLSTEEKYVGRRGRIVNDVVIQAQAQAQADSPEEWDDNDIYLSTEDNYVKKTAEENPSSEFDRPKEDHNPPISPTIIVPSPKEPAPVPVEESEPTGEPSTSHADDGETTPTPEPAKTKYQIIDASISDEDIEKTATGYAMDAIEELDEKQKRAKIEKKFEKYKNKHPDEFSNVEEFQNHLNKSRIRAIGNAIKKNLNLPAEIARMRRLRRYKTTAEEAIRKTGNLSAASAAVEEVNNWYDDKNHASFKDSKSNIIKKASENTNNDINEAVLGRVKNVANGVSGDTGIEILQNSDEIGEDEDGEKYKNKTFAEVRNAEEEELSADEQIKKIFGEYAEKIVEIDKKDTGAAQEARNEMLEKIKEAKGDDSGVSIDNYEQIAKKLQEDKELRGITDIEKIDDFLEKNVSIVSADAEIGLAAKEIYTKLRDRATLEHGIIAGTAISIGAGLMGVARSKVTQKIAGPGAIATVSKVVLAGLTGGAVASMAEKNRQGRENIKDALSGETVEHESDKDRYKVLYCQDAIKEMNEMQKIFSDEQIIEEEGMTTSEKAEKIGEFEKEKKEKIPEAINLIAEYRVRNKLQNENSIQLIGFGSREEIEKNKLEFFKSLNELEAKIKEEYKSTNIETALQEAEEKAEEKISEEIGDVEKNQKIQRRKAAIKGAIIAAGISYATTRIGNLIPHEAVDAPGGESGTSINNFNLNEYLNNPDNEDVVNYSNINFDSSQGTSIGDPELYDDGYHIPISNVPEESEFIVGVKDGQALSADIVTTEDGDSYALLKTDTAIFNTVQDDEITGDWFSVGVENEDGTFTSYASEQCTQPFDGDITVKDSETAKEIADYNAKHSDESAAALSAKYDTIEFKDGDTADLKIIHGGYDATKDPFWSSTGSDFGESIEADTPEEALSEWVENIQKSPDQLVWNSMGMAGFEESQEVEDFFTENFGEDWRTEFHIEGEIDTEEEVNIVANKIAENSEVYEEYKELFLKEFINKMENGSVEIEQIDAGGRYSNFQQANQYVNNESDVTNSIIRAAKSNTGGTGLVIQDAEGNSIFDESKMNKMLKVADGQDVSNTMIRMECGGQTTKVIESYGNADVQSHSSSGTTTIDDDNPTPTSGPTPTDTPEPTPTVEPTDTPEPTPTVEPTDTPEPTPTDTPTPTVEPTDTPTPTIVPKDSDNLKRIDDNINKDIADDVGTEKIKITPTDKVSDDDITEKPDSSSYEGTEPEIVQNQPSESAKDVSGQVSEGNDYSNNNGSANDGYKPVKDNTSAQDSADSDHANDKPASTDEAADAFGF